MRSVGSSFHLLQLALHCRSLGLHNTDLGGGALVPTFASGLHFVQLATEDKISGPSDPHVNKGQNGNDPTSSRRAPGSTVYGALKLFVGAAFLKVALDSTNAPRNPVWLILCAWGIGLFAAIGISQGTILLRTGEWLL
jgi:hypothetical protein